MKKFSQILLAAGLAMSMTASPIMSAVTTMPVFAEVEKNEDSGTVTIGNFVKGATYNLYEIMKIDYYKDGKYLYVPTNEWKAFIETGGAGASYFNVIEGETTRYSWKSNDNTAAFAAAAKAYLDQNPSIAATKTGTGPENGDLSISDVNYGWYLMTSSVGTAVSLGVAAPNTTINEKNGTPTIDKKVAEDSESNDTNKYDENNDDKIGATVDYKSLLTVQSGAENYVVHDKMSDGLTFNGSVSVKIGDNTVGAENYDLTTENLGDGCDFEISFKNNFIKNLASGTVLTIEYSATINEGAKIGGEANTNEIRLQYGDTNNPTYTPWVTTETYVWSLDVFKYTGTNTALDGATFTIAEGGTIINLVKVTDGEYRVAKSGETGVTEFTTKDGNVTIKGLDAGTYTVTETEAPAGYNKLKDPIVVKIAGTRGSEAIEGKQKGDVIKGNDKIETLNIQNNTGSTLPDTGGMGTTMLYIAGGVLVLGSVVFFMTNRKMKKD